MHLHRQMAISHISDQFKGSGSFWFSLSEIGKERCHRWFCCCYLHTKGGWEGEGREIFTITAFLGLFGHVFIIIRFIGLPVPI